MKFFTFILSVGFLISVFVLGVHTTQAETNCVFTRDLQMEIVGEDVKCLQKYLNSSGFTITDSGVGSPGKETNQFKGLTKNAIIKWQTANGISPASGYFGAKSRAKYDELVNKTVPSTAVLNTPAPVVSNSNSAVSQVPDVIAVQQKAAELLIKKAIKAVEDADEQIDDARNDGTDVRVADENLDDARSDLFEAVDSYFAKNYSNAIKYGDDAYENAIDAYEDAGGETDEDEADNAIDKAEDAIELAENKIEAADDADEDVDEAEDLLEDAENKLEEAEQAFDDEDYEEAINIAEEAEELADDAIDAIGENSEKDNAKKAIRNAQNTISDAEDDISEADDDGDDVDDAEDLLDDARDALADAEDEYDDENYKEAKNLANDAKALAEDAIDEL